MAKTGEKTTKQMGRKCEKGEKKSPFFNFIASYVFIRLAIYVYWGIAILCKYSAWPKTLAIRGGLSILSLRNLRDKSTRVPKNVGDALCPISQEVGIVFNCPTYSAA